VTLVRGAIENLRCLVFVVPVDVDGIFDCCCALACAEEWSLLFLSLLVWGRRRRGRRARHGWHRRRDTLRCRECTGGGVAEEAAGAVAPPISHDPEAAAARS
jgi:hypothetical protein